MQINHELVSNALVQQLTVSLLCIRHLNKCFEAQGKIYEILIKETRHKVGPDQQFANNHFYTLEWREILQEKKSSSPDR